MSYFASSSSYSNTFQVSVFTISQKPINVGKQKNIDNQKTKTKKHIYNIITIAPNYLHEVPDISWIFQVQYYWNNQKNYFFKVTIDRPVLEWMNKMFKDGRSADVSLLRYIQ